ncbi:unnamed protein product [Microthlaspi erraticum]|uniref:Uncharacterized protein n=1 Tax=Microthlaspi erraticum TaxID=1685480 RepID=A0A6D2I8F8_9BRAS|nr:unnamed protein product [Microthlaspi erraticum]
MSPPKQTDDGNTIVEETTGVGHRISALEQKVEKIKSFLVKIEKFLDDKDRLEKQNLGGKEKEESSVLDELQQCLRDAKVTKNQKEEIQASRAIASHAGGSPESSDPILEQDHLMTVPEEKNGSLTQSHQWVTQKNDESLTRRFEPLFDGGNAEGWVIRVEQYFERGKVTEQKLFGIVNTEKKDTQEENQSAEMDRNACQVFDEITQEGKKVAKKRKKKIWKASLKVHERLEKQLSSEEKRKTSLSCEEIRNGFYVNRKQGDIKKSIYASQVFDKRSRKKKRETRKRKNKKFTKAKRSKYKRWKGDPLNFQSHKARGFNIQRTKRIKGCNIVKSCWIVLNELLVWEIRVKKKKKMVCTKSRSVKYKHRKLDQEKLIRILKKNMFRGHKT